MGDGLHCGIALTSAKPKKNDRNLVEIQTAIGISIGALPRCGTQVDVRSNFSISSVIELLAQCIASIWLFNQSAQLI